MNKTNIITFSQAQIKKGLLNKFLEFLNQMTDLENKAHWEAKISFDPEFTTVEFQESVETEHFEWVETEEEQFALEDVQANENARYEINPEMNYSFPNKANEQYQLEGKEITEIINKALEEKYGKK